MSKFIPDYVFDSIFDITPELLKRHGIRAALIDLDGTMVSHKTALPTDEVASFVRRAGALTCYVETLDRRFFWINVRYQLERGFIARGRRRMEARRHE